MSTTKERRPSMPPWQLLLLGCGVLGASSKLALDLGAFARMGQAYAVALGVALALLAAQALVLSDLACRHRSLGLLYDLTRALGRGAVGLALARTLGLAWLGVILLAAAGEANELASLLEARLGVAAPLGVSLLLGVVYLIAARGEGQALRVVLVLAALGLTMRLSFGVLAISGFSHAGEWALTNLDLGQTARRGTWELVPLALPAAIWSLVGLELLVPIVSRSSGPSRSRAPGLGMAMFGALLVTLLCVAVFGAGCIGVQSSAQWRPLLFGSLQLGREPVALLVGEQLFGQAGVWSMLFLSVVGGLSSLLVAQLATSRVFAAMLERRDQAETYRANGHWVLVMLIAASVLVGSESGWLSAALYGWLPLLAAALVLALVSRRQHPHLPRLYPCPVLVLGAVSGLLVLVSLHRIAFERSQVGEAPRALLLFGLAALLAIAVQLRSGSLRAAAIPD